MVSEIAPDCEAPFYLTVRSVLIRPSGKIRTEEPKKRRTILTFLDLALLASYAGTKAVPVRTPVQSPFRGPAAWARNDRMLVLSRKKNESIVIADDITIVVVEIRGDKVRLGVEAPKEVPVHRREVFDAIRRNEAAANEGKTDTAKTNKDS